MSLRYEQYNAIKMTRELLVSLLYPKETPGVPKQIRLRAGRCLRHFPFLRESGQPMWSQDEFTKDEP